MARAGAGTTAGLLAEKVAEVGVGAGTEGVEADCTGLKRPLPALVGSARFLFRLAAFLSAAFSAFSSRFSSLLSSANSSAVYSATTPQSNSDQSAIRISFWRSARSFLPVARASWARWMEGALPDSCVSSAWASAMASSTLSLKVACSSLPFRLKG